MRVVALVALGLLVGSASSAWAGSCGDSGNQFDLDRCADQDFRKADAALNATYRKVMERLADTSAKRKLLIEAQKAWLGFRDAQCAFATSDSLDGSMHPIVVSGCRKVLTETRTKTLEGFLTCQEGDTECPLPSR